VLRVCVYDEIQVEQSKKCTRSWLSQEEASRQTTLESRTVPHFVTSSPKQDQKFSTTNLKIIMVCIVID
jgi:hypothetical protein